MRSPHHRRLSTAAATAFVLIGGSLAGAIAVARIDSVGPLARSEFDPIVSLPTAALLMLAGGVVAAVLSLRVWWLGTALFFVWMPFEDLLRKFQGNDLRIYAIKDFLLVLALLAALPKLQGAWRKPLGNAWLPTVLVLLVAAAWSIRTAVESPLIPLNAFHLRFLYLLLLPIGVVVGRDRDLLKRTLGLLCLIAIITCSVGIIQDIVDIDFLNPRNTDPLLENLTITKTITGIVRVVRPPGTFVDAGRFGTYTTVAIVLGACLLQLAGTLAYRRLSYATILVGLWATFISGGRAAFVFGVVIVAFTLVFTGDTTARRRRQALAALLAGGLTMAIVVGGAVGGGAPEAATYYGETLGFGRNSEIAKRGDYYVSEFLAGLRAGGVSGRGTGDQAIGQQYFGEREYVAESGFGSIAVEWGVGGLILWIVWTAAWIRRAVEASKRQDAPSGPVTRVILVYVVLTLTLGTAFGIQYFENYVTNIYLWFLSGVAFAAATHQPMLDGLAGADGSVVAGAHV